MKLTLAQMVLEEAAFGHKGDFLGKPPTTPVPESVVEIGIELAKPEDLSTALVRLRVTCDPEEGYTYKVTYSAIFKVTKDDKPVPEDLDRRLMVTGATMLFPFAREMVASLTMRGRFGPTWLSPTNFNAVIAKNPEMIPANAGERTGG